ncbi:serine hydrolase domain-containing protein [Paraburkholderia flagellata]|uniref:serine hydrolase domain-containing protein n=1 Tax=Paraburkholderia flagellata TaxID=2883241 RepID=UPI001F2F98CB|nr:serine hydrolase [Paraburkholderia flagellata]
MSEKSFPWRRFLPQSALLVMSLSLFACGGGSDGSSPASIKLPALSNLFNWTQAEKVVGFSHSAEILSTEPFKSSGNPGNLPDAASAVAALAANTVYQYGKNPDGTLRTNNTVDDYMNHNKISGLLVIKNGAVALERYAMGMDRNTLWDSKSAGKSVVSVLMGAALKDGSIKSLDDTVEKYVPELAGSAYQGVTLRNLLHMSSGVAWNENYLDSRSDIVAVINCVAHKTAGCILNHMKTLARAKDANTGAPTAQGTVWNYSTGEAFVSGLVVQRATGMSLSKYIQSKIWQPFGMEADGNWWLESDGGVSFGGGGFNATLRDYGRLGLFVLNNGKLANGTSVLPDNWVTDSTTWISQSAVPGYADNGSYGNMWWFNPAYDDGVHNASPLFTNIGAPLQNTTVPTGAVPVQSRGPVQDQPGASSDWTFMAIGVFGQMIAINQRENLVVVEWGVWDKPDPHCCDSTDPTYIANNPYNEEAIFVNALTEALH